MTNFAVATISDTGLQATTNTSRFRTIAGIRLERNTVLLGAILVAIVFAAMIGALSLGDYPMTAWETIANLFGFSDDYLGQFFVQSQRLPRVMATIAVGAALGVSGCIFQQLSGNTLGSPDIIGFTTGSATGAVVTIIVLDGSPIATAVGALLGGAGSALAHLEQRETVGGPPGAGGHRHGINPVGGERATHGESINQRRPNRRPMVGRLVQRHHLGRSRVCPVCNPGAGTGGSAAGSTAIGHDYRR